MPISYLILLYEICSSMSLFIDKRLHKFVKKGLKTNVIYIYYTEILKLLTII